MRIGDISRVFYLKTGQFHFTIYIYTSDLFQLLNENFDTTISNTNTIETFSSISINNVSFKYPGTNRIVLKDINLNIFSGESICIVGKNGSGKSTLVKLILGLYPPNEGKTFVDENDLNDLKRNGLSYASAVFQDYAKYGFSLKENIIFDGNISKNDLIETLMNVGFTEKELYDLPNCLDTYLNREYDLDGILLSEGQWQRVAVARALCNQMPLIILDEPTSNLDPFSEETIYNLINKQRGTKTVIMVSHRLSGVINADKIIVVDDGKIVCVGKHDELIEKCDIYKTMFNLQLSRYLKNI